MAELHAYVIRGNMSRPTSGKPPAIEPPRKSEAYRLYALGRTTPRLHFLLNTGDAAGPRAVPVLVAARLERQLDAQAARFLRRTVRVDVARRVVLLPRVCDVYRHDFGRDPAGAGMAALKYCLPFLDEPTALLIERLQSEEAPWTVKFAPPSESFHSTLTEVLDSDDSEAAVYG